MSEAEEAPSSGEIPELIDEIALLVQQSVDTWTEYERKWEHDYKNETNSDDAMDLLQEFRHAKAAHLRQIAIAKSELLAMRFVYWGQ